MSDRNKTFQTVRAMLSLRDTGDKSHNLRDFHFSDGNRNIPVTMGFDIGTAVENFNREIAISNKKNCKPTVYMEMAKYTMRRENIDLREIKGLNNQLTSDVAMQNLYKNITSLINALKAF